MERIQYNFHTEMFRQTSQLKTARSRLNTTKPNAKIRILSFGSSIGEEIATLRYMFPDADIHGCDIDDKVLQICERSVGKIANIFRSTEENIKAHGPYDMIVASAVLCLNPTPDDFVQRFPVSRFDDTVSLLDDNLAPGGILVITNASYRFTEGPLARNYDTIRSDIVSTAGFVDVFTRESELYLKRIGTSGGYIHKRLGSFVPRDDEDLADSLFEKHDHPRNPEIHYLRLAEPPESRIVLHRHVRLNTDWANKQIGHKMITIEYAYELCRRPDTDEHGYVQTISWTSLVGEGMYRRLPTWNSIP